MKEEERKSVLFAVALKKLQEINFWPKNGNKMPFVFFSWFFILGFFMVLGLTGHIYKSFETGRTSDLVNDLFFLLIGLFATTTTLVFYIRRHETFRFYHRLNEVYGMSQKHQKLVQHLEKMTKFLYLHSVIGNTIFLIFTYLSDIECFQRKKDGTGDGYICGVLYPFWFPFNLDSTPWKQIIHAMEFIEIIYITPKLAVVCIFFYGAIVILEDRINRLKKFIKKIRITEHNSKEVSQNLKYVVEEYSDITELVNEVNSTIGVIFSPSQHILLGLIISLMEFQAVVEKKGNAIPTLIFWFLFESLTCWKGQCLEDASVSLAEQVYEFPWYELDPSARSIFKLFYGQVQITLQLKCPPIITINFAYFYEVMKGSYSLLMYLQKMK